uniref:Uncharacterized protein n=1 Tax=Leersia perrieri TaxID=77586 RepID=A0A0D9VKK2_9ORYZ
MSRYLMSADEVEHFVEEKSRICGEEIMVTIGAIVIRDSAKVATLLLDWVKGGIRVRNYSFVCLARMLDKEIEWVCVDCDMILDTLRGGEGIVPEHIRALRRDGYELREMAISDGDGVFTFIAELADRVVDIADKSIAFEFTPDEFETIVEELKDSLVSLRDHNVPLPKPRQMLAEDTLDERGDSMAKRDRLMSVTEVRACMEEHACGFGGQPRCEIVISAVVLRHCPEVIFLLNAYSASVSVPNRRWLDGLVSLDHCLTSAETVGDSLIARLDAHEDLTMDAGILRAVGEGVLQAAYKHPLLPQHITQLGYRMIATAGHALHLSRVHVRLRAEIVYLVFDIRQARGAMFLFVDP